jgi:hypothetical protein
MLPVFWNHTASVGYPQRDALHPHIVREEARPRVARLENSVADRLLKFEYAPFSSAQNKLPDGK